MTPSAYKAARLGFLVFLVADGMFFAGLAGAWLVLTEKEAMRRLLIGLYLAHLAVGVVWTGGSVFRRAKLDLLMIYSRFLCAVGFLLFLLLYAGAWF